MPFVAVQSTLHHRFSVSHSEGRGAGEVGLGKRKATTAFTFRQSFAPLQSTSVRVRGSFFSSLLIELRLVRKVLTRKAHASVVERPTLPPPVGRANTGGKQIRIHTKRDRERERPTQRPLSLFTKMKSSAWRSVRWRRARPPPAPPPCKPSSGWTSLVYAPAAAVSLPVVAVSSPLLFPSSL